MIRTRLILPLTAIIGASFLAACSRSVQLPPGLAGDSEIREFLDIALDDDTDSATRYAALEPVIARSRSAGESVWLGMLLNGLLEKRPDDPYGAYYLLALAEGARDAGSEEPALYYLRRLVNNYPDLEISGQSIHFLAMSEIARMSQDPREVISTRTQMQEMYPDRIDKGRNLYSLAQAYRRIGEWDAMYTAYEEFLQYPGTDIPGVPDAYSSVWSALEFHRSDKSWTMESLESLVSTVQYAIRTVNVPLLTKHQSGHFFLMNWTQETSDAFTHIPMTLGSFLSANVRFKPNLEPYSNDREAFLWTAGWTYQIPTWYLYFRRIDYPVNPEINGRWEWAGIYFGEPL